MWMIQQHMGQASSISKPRAPASSAREAAIGFADAVKTAIAAAFAGLATQRAREAAAIHDYYRQDRFSDFLEAEIGKANSRR